MTNPLKSWLNEFPRSERQAKCESLAVACGVGVSSVRGWISGIHPVPPKAAPAVQLHTGLHVSAVRPDIYPAWLFNQPSQAAQ